MSATPRRRDGVPGTMLLVLYGIGEAAVTVAMVIFGLFVLFFYTAVMHLPPLLVGAASAAGLAWDAVADPLIGHWSDRTIDVRWRRHGFMLAGALLMGVAFWALLAPPLSWPPAAVFLWLVATTLVFRTVSALFRIPYLGLGAELADDYHQRTIVVAVRAFFGLAGTLTAASLSFPLFFPTVAAGVDPKLSYAGYPALGLSAGALMTSTALVATVGTWGAARRPDAAPCGRGFAPSLRTALASGPFRRVWLSFTLFFAGVVLNAVLTVHFFTWSVRIADSGALGAVQSAFYAGALGGVFVWTWAARRAEKQHVAAVATLGTAALMALATVAFGDGRPFGTGRVGPLAAGYVLAGAVASALWVIPGSMVADVVDHDELAGGRRRAGLFFGMLDLGEKVAGGVALLAAGALLQYFVRLPLAGRPDAAAASRLGVAFGVAPALVLAAAALPLVGYPLTSLRVASIQQAVTARSIKENVAV